MSRQIAELRTWVLIAASFVVGALCSEFVDYLWQSSEDMTMSLVTSHEVPAENQP